MPLTSKGFERLSYNDILQNKINKAKELFGEDIDTSQLTPLGKFIRINAYDLAEAEEEAEYIYYSIFPNTASGISLDRLCIFVGISRNAATAARYKVMVYGTDGYTVPIGFLVGTEDGSVNFYNITASKITDGSCEITVECTETGTTGNVLAKNINTVINPVAEVTRIEGTKAVVEGETEETDYALRKRFEQAREGAGSCTEASIKAALMRVTDVKSVGIIVNDTETEDDDGRPPHSFECYIYGNEKYKTEIAETIYNKKPIGIKTHGDYTVEITDDSGNKHDIQFSFVEQVSIYVETEIRTNSYYIDNSADEIRDNLQDYIDNLGAGEDVVLSSLYGKIHAVEGVEEVKELKLSTEDDNFKENSITIENNQIAHYSGANIKVVS